MTNYENHQILLKRTLSSTPLEVDDFYNLKFGLEKNRIGRLDMVALQLTDEQRAALGEDDGSKIGSILEIRDKQTGKPIDWYRIRQVREQEYTEINNITAMQIAVDLFDREITNRKEYPVGTTDTLYEVASDIVGSSFEIRVSQSLQGTLVPSFRSEPGPILNVLTSLADMIEADWFVDVNEDTNKVRFNFIDDDDVGVYGNPSYGLAWGDRVVLYDSDTDIQNLIPNGGFETYTTSPGAPDGYSTQGDNITFDKETTNVRSGSNAVKMTITSGTGSVFKGLKKSFSVTTDTAYYVEVWAKRLTGTQTVGAYLEVFNTTDSLAVASVTAPLHDSAVGYERLSFVFSTVAGKSYEVRFGSVSANTNDVFFFDDITVRKIVVKDSSGQGNHGSILALSATATGVLNKRVGLTGRHGLSHEFYGLHSNEKIITPDLGLTGTSDFTIEFWANFNNVTNPGSGSGYKLVAKGSTANSMGFDRDINNVRFGIRDAGTNLQTVTYSNSNLVTDRWYHFLGTYKAGEELRLYVDGVLVDSEAIVTDYSAVPSGQFTIAGNGVLSGTQAIPSFEGRIDDVRFYDRVLTAEEASERFNNNTAITIGLILWYNLDEDGGVDAGRFKDRLLDEDLALWYRLDETGGNTGSNISNGGFETWTDPNLAPDDWAIDNIAEAATPIREQTIVRTGTNSARIERASGTGAIVLRRVLSLTAGRSYFVEFWVRVTGMTQGQIALDIRNTTDNISTKRLNFDANTSGTSFVKHSFVFTPTSGKTYQVRAFHDSTSVTNVGAAVYVDDVVVQEVQVIDHSKFQRHGRIVNDTNRSDIEIGVSGKRGTSYVFTGTSSFSGFIEPVSSFPSNPDHPIEGYIGPLSIDAWIRLDSPTPGAQVPLGAILTTSNFAGGTKGGWVFGTNSSRKLGFALSYKEFDTETEVSNTTLNLGELYHVAMVYDHSDFKVRLYINGVLDAEREFTSVIRGNFPPQFFRVGSDETSGPEQAFNGLIDEIRVVKRLLTDKEIQDRYNLRETNKGFTPLAEQDVFSIRRIDDDQDIFNDIQVFGVVAGFNSPRCRIFDSTLRIGRLQASMDVSSVPPGTPTAVTIRDLDEAITSTDLYGTTGSAILIVGNEAMRITAVGAYDSSLRTQSVTLNRYKVLEDSGDADFFPTELDDAGYFSSVLTLTGNGDYDHSLGTLVYQLISEGSVGSPSNPQDDTSIDAFGWRQVTINRTEIIDQDTIDQLAKRVFLKYRRPKQQIEIFLADQGILAYPGDIVDLLDENGISETNDEGYFVEKSEYNGEDNGTYYTLSFNKNFYFDDVADLMKEVEVSNIYGQGSNSIDTISVADNISGHATEASRIPLVLDFYSPLETKAFNSSLLTVRVQKFRNFSSGSSSVTSSDQQNLEWEGTTIDDGTITLDTSGNPLTVPAGGFADFIIHADVNSGFASGTEEEPVNIFADLNVTFTPENRSYAAQLDGVNSTTNEFYQLGKFTDAGHRPTDEDYGGIIINPKNVYLLLSLQNYDKDTSITFNVELVRTKYSSTHNHGVAHTHTPAIEQAAGVANMKLDLIIDNGTTPLRWGLKKFTGSQQPIPVFGGNNGDLFNDGDSIQTLDILPMIIRAYSTVGFTGKILNIRIESIETGKIARLDARLTNQMFLGTSSKLKR